MAIDILMSTYNGENYLENQLFSLLMQRYKEWTLYIRDDGSTDNTLSIISKFCKLDQRIKLVEQGVNLGYGASFMKLIQYSRADYVAFCDQDDIWFEDKLLRCLEQAKQLDDHQTPLLVCCQGYTYSDQTGTITGALTPQYQAKELKNFLFLNGGYQGCLFLVNKAMIDNAKTYNKPVHGHDNIMCLIAHSFGKIYFLKMPLMLYRQHKLNLSGNVGINFFSKLKAFFRSGAVVVTSVAYKQQQDFFDFFKDKISKPNKEIYQLYFSFPNLSRLDRIKLVIKNRFTLGQYKWALIVKTLLRRPI